MDLRRSRSVGGWLVALLLLPIVLGVLPPIETSAEEALTRDLALSVCTPNGAQDRGQTPASHGQQCVLCAVGCAFAAPMMPGGAGAELAQALAADFATPIFASDARPNWPHWRDGFPPRGPPAFLIA
jgi:hypothetical protein